MIEIEEKGNYATIKILREEKANSLNMESIEELFSAIKPLEKKSNILSVIITGSGKFFSAGGDLSQMLKLDENEGIRFSMLGQELMDYIENSTKIFIAAMNGPAYGGGMELALACDIRIASKNVKMGQTEINVGLVTGWGGAERLIRYVGKSLASYLLLKGEVIDAETAMRYGLIHQISEDPLSDAIKFAENLSKKNPDAVRAYKLMLKENSYLLERSLFGKIVSSRNGKEAINAFFEKREPKFL
ncbi:MAG: enoyl-CoA hydratase/isomerase family protein [Thermoplasmata archaeon]|nr:enoyl-CoA hydratase/isomerase family protein [Thermoplasmata archaeon]